MGLIAVDLTTEASYASGAFSHNINPPAIQWVHPEGDGLKQVFSLYQGSGGVVASLLSISPSGANIQVHIEPQNRLANAINEICQTFGLTKEDLRQVCNIQSRKTLYNWINGDAKPRKSAMDRIFDLLIAAKAWRSSGFTADPKRLHEPVLGDQSLFTLLNLPQIDKERILFAGSRLNMLTPVKDALTDPFA